MRKIILKKVGEILTGKNSQRGLSMVEIIVSLGVLSGVAYMGISGLRSLNKTMKDTEVRGTRADIVEGLFSRFGDNAKNLQVDHSDKSANEIFEDMKELPMAWEVDGRMGKISECGKCKGRYAVVVKPYTNYRGLFEMTVRVTHPSINKGKGFLEITKLLGNF